MDVAVVIPARDAERTLPATLAALRRQKGQSLLSTDGVVVVDNGSRDGTAAVAEAAGVRVIRRERGEGPGAARNAGVAACDAEAIAFTDADCVPAPGWVEAGARALGDADLVQGRVLPIRPPGRMDHTVTVEGPSPLFETANLFVRREWFDRAGGFGPGVSAAGRPFGEDVVFGWALRRLGARTAYAADALVHHEVFPRGPRAYLAERWRLQHFPALVKLVPELRQELHRGVFLSRRTASFDALLVAGMLMRRPWLPCALRPADAVGAAALLYGSLRARELVM